jgi:hypothetical protein
MMKIFLAFQVGLVGCMTGSNNVASSFRLSPTSKMILSPVLYSTHKKSSLVVRYSSKNDESGSSFLQGVLESAFANDKQLLSQNNKRVGMLDEALDEDDTVILKPQQSAQLTATQQAWRQSMTVSSSKVQSSDLVGSTINVDLYLAGVPNKDPSNDLYGGKTNISARDRSVGQVLPSSPTISNIQIQFEPNQKCTVSTVTTSLPATQDDINKNSVVVAAVENSSPTNAAANNFVNTQIQGDWKLSDDGSQIRFRFQVYGFQRTVQTKGTIQKIYWSQENESITETSTLYTIPEGWLYLETDLSRKNNGNIQWTNTNVMNRSPAAAATSSSSSGIVKVEQAMGFLGIASRMIPCGKFIVVATSK